ncbi:hypothetical protein [Caulobacter sp. BK020]|uniref:hypothetical protein n=1 Tax=Caulobacter sp. BK020 TaxID=2512117 RepID=UPI00104F0E5E|nr:hypothetical protein [Caulobacter sp. BK020]TCS10475.1 hypothetical protein EV278_11757 [Caulobacter sp. BK020]
MTSPAALALVFAVLTAFLVGYRAPGAPVEPLGLSRYPHAAASRLLIRPNEITLAALDDFQVDLVPHGTVGPDLDPVAAQGDPLPPSETAIAPPPPPPPDIALVFRQRLTAIVDQGPAGLAALVLDPSQEARATRLVRPGDIFEGRWRLEALTSSEAVLRDGRRTRRVAFYGAAGSTAEL